MSEERFWLYLLNGLTGLSKMIAEFSEQSQGLMNAGQRLSLAGDIKRLQAVLARHEGDDAGRQAERPG